MNIVTFQSSHIEQAKRIIRENYDEERKHVPVLPEIHKFPDLGEFAENGLGVALFEKGEMLGFLCCFVPMDFGMAKETFSPIHAHGTVNENRNRIYSYLYQNAAKKWVRKGILKHFVAMYAHDTEATNSFFWNGFGLRCINAIRPVEKLNSPHIDKCEFGELPEAVIAKILPLKNGLVSHLFESPVFLRYPLFDEASFVETTRRKRSRFFCAMKNNQIIAYIEITASGENFITYNKKMMNICGGFMVPKYRGSGIYTRLLQFLLRQLEAEGFLRLGVDFESLNPTAKGFWLKYFTPYTHCVVRTIDLIF